MIRYRTGIDAKTGKVLVGFAHLEQSVAKIVMTAPTERVMLLDFGFEPARRLGRNISAALAATLYRDLITAIHKWEPEYRIARLQLANLDRIGGMGVVLAGLYYPEGRFGNYDISEEANLNIPLALTHRGVA
ncbi:GPW/gp25 family protein [Methylosinus sp. Sm6]|uniref:GPW/gp25 family protein n=1 Tax=Methylosinus sp. Sm6 TaxID=2866948 RepID=UPI001C99D23F|nr:GPW/gp25 family protein [Methylosinus sp. Sm6]MBY6244107.1 GPW/gp25 family protein [Methylosinus sp. Sm6]